jgi:ribonuclease D
MEKPKSYRVHLPPREQSHAKPDEHVLGRLLGVALANRCAEEDLSMSMVATNNDLLEFIRWHVEGRTGDKPVLAEGWRHEICGSFLGDILDGKIYIRVGDARADCPLVFEKKGREKSKE